jgi:microcystin-dependent protein
MVETVTAHYGWVKPEIAHSPSTWGGFLNTNLDSIDSLVFANQQGLVPIGGIQMFGGATAPANWLICDGRSLATTGTYAALFAAIGYAHGGSGVNFNLPNLVNKFARGANGSTGLGATGGEATHVLTAAELPAHAHPITDVPHGHGVNQWAHNHGITTGNHAHGITTGSHSHGLTQAVGLSYTTSGGAGAQTVTAGAGPIRTDTAGNLGGNTDTAGNLGGNTDTQTSSISIQASGTGLSTTQNVGSGAAHNNLPPYAGVNFIIRYQ